jgi:DinB family protein
VNPDVLHEITVVADQIAELVRGLAGATANAHRGAARTRAAGAGKDPRVPGSDWSVLETAAHLAVANGHFAEIAAGANPARHGDGTKAGLATANALLLQRFPVRDAVRLADQITAAAGEFVRHAQARAAGDEVDTPLGAMTVEATCGYLLAHLLSHGCAVARAVHRPTLVRPDQVSLMVPFLLVAMPRLVDPAAVADLVARYELRLRGSIRLTVGFDRGAVTVVDADHLPVDCVISVDPTSFFLITAGLRRQWPLIAQGRLRAWGRRPWLGPRFAKYFSFP